MNYRFTSSREFAMPAQGASEAELTRGVARLVRETRGARGLTRRALAAAAGISERYLALLEAGGANVSLNLLARIGRALGVSLHALIPGSPEPGAGPQKKGLALLGLRGAGMSTLGEALAARAGLPFIRLNQLISERAGMEAGELMELAGSQAFRRMEAEALEDLVRAPGRIVLETGGGIVADRAAYDLVRRHFHTVWIKASPEDHMARVVAQNDLRPMVGRAAAMDDLRRLLAERAAAYGEADCVLDTHGLTVAEAGARLAQLVEPALA
jgi:XRE family aerobic/anaerobic benzoate catabolism transcriptional regulator